MIFRRREEHTISPCRPGPDPGPLLEVSEQVREAVMRSFRQESPVVLILYGVRVPPMLSGAFDVVAKQPCSRRKI
jgi:hypothetical protein